VDFRLQKKSQSAWINEARACLDGVLTKNPDDLLARLFMAQLEISRGHTESGAEMVEAVESCLLPGAPASAPEDWFCYISYLHTLIDIDETKAASALVRIKKLYRVNPSNWHLAWLLLYLDEQLVNNKESRFTFIKNACENSSPSLLLAEALRLVIEDAGILNVMTSFELRLLSFAVSKKRLTKSIVYQVGLLSPTAGLPVALLYRVLKACLELDLSLPLLELMAETVMRYETLSDDERAFWLEFAIENGCFVPGIYEAFIQSISEEYSKPMPLEAAYYFAGSADLSQDCAAIFYKNVLSYPETFKSVYSSVYDSALRFALDSLKQRIISRSLAFIYMQTLSAQLLIPEVADALAELIFACEVDVPNENVRHVVLIYDKLIGETRYPVRAGKAIVYCFSRYKACLFEDQYGNRTTVDEETCVRPLFELPRFIVMLSALDVSNIKYDIYLSEAAGGFIQGYDGNLDALLRIVLTKDVRKECRREAMASVLTHLESSGRFEELDTCLMVSNPSDLPAQFRSTVLEMLVNRSMYEKALDWLRHFGTHRVPDWVVMRTVSAAVKSGMDSYDPVLTSLCYRMFSKQKSDESTLGYLAIHYGGGLKGMMDILEACSALGLNCALLSERIIRRVVACGQSIGEKMRLYLTCKGTADADLLAAFLVYWSIDYVCRDGHFAFGAAMEIARLFESVSDVPAIAKAALLKYLAEDESALAQFKPLARKCAVQLASQGRIFSFLKAYSQICPELASLKNDEIIEFHSLVLHQVTIHYCFDHGSNEPAVFKIENMQKSVPGVYTARFRLYHGESLRYYITCGNVCTDEETRVGGTDIEGKGFYWEPLGACDFDRFELANSIIKSYTDGDREEFVRLLSLYERAKYINNELFTTI